MPSETTHIPMAPKRTPLVRWVGYKFCCLCMILLTVWAVLALYFDCKVPGLNLLAAIAYVAVVAACLFFFKRPLYRPLSTTLCFAIVLVWWIGLVPSNEGDWQADVSHIAFVDVEGSKLTFHNVRSCDYRTDLDYTCNWLTREIDLDQVQGVDLFLNYWGSPWIAHTIVSFDLGSDPSHPPVQKVDPIVFSIEARKHVGQKYSAVLGFFRQFTLIAVVSNERDVVRLRTNYRPGEDLYLYHIRELRSLHVVSCSVTHHSLTASRSA